MMKISSFRTMEINHMLAASEEHLFRKEEHEALRYFTLPYSHSHPT